MPSGSRDVGRVLLAALRGVTGPAGGTEARAWSRVDPAELVAAAQFHGIVGHVRRFAEGAGAPEAALAPLRHAELQAAGRHLVGLADLRGLGAALDARGVPWLVVKGPVLADVHGAPGLRGYGDLDVVVPATRLDEALAAVLAVGGEIVDRNWRLLAERRAGELHCLLPNGTYLDLHWHLFADPRDRARFPVDMAGLFARRRLLAGPSGAMPTLDAADTVLHVAAHAVLSGAHRLVWHADMRGVLRADAPDPAVLSTRATAGSLGLVLSTMLWSTTRLTADAVVTGWTRRFPAPAAWRAALSAAHRLSPPERVRDRSGSPLQLTARATSRTVAASFADVGRRGLAWTRDRGRSPHRDPVLRGDPDSPLSILHDRGQEGWQRRYLEHVTTEPTAC